MKKVLLAIALITSTLSIAKIGTGLRSDTDTYGCGCNGYSSRPMRRAGHTMYGPNVVLVEDNVINGLGLVEDDVFMR